MKQFQRIFFLTLLLLVFQVPALTFGADQVSLQLMWKNQFQFAGYYAAKEFGFYEDAGLDVDIKEFEIGIDVTADVISQKSHFGVGRSSLLLDSI